MGVGFWKQGRKMKEENKTYKRPEVKKEVKPEVKPEIKETPVAKEGTDGKFTMVKNGVGRRFHASKIKDAEKNGWALV